ncbi:MAG: antitoxin VbhA family protein [Gammaproteobacteria bacterium]
MAKPTPPATMIDPATLAKRRANLAAYEASMAIEGLEIHPDDRAVLDRIVAENLTPEERRLRIFRHLQGAGVIPADQPEPPASAAQ